MIVLTFPGDKEAQNKRVDSIVKNVGVPVKIIEYNGYVEILVEPYRKYNLKKIVYYTIVATLLILTGAVIGLTIKQATAVTINTSVPENPCNSCLAVCGLEK
jgi:hypothetical protein